MSNEILVGQGLLARYLVVEPLSNAGNRPYYASDISKDRVIIEFWDHLSTLLDNPFPLENPDIPNELSPRKLELDCEAKSLWIRYHDSVDKRLSSDGDLYPVRRIANKAAEQVLRIAGILTIFEDFNAESISLKHVGRAIKLMQFYLNEALRIFEKSDSDPQLELAQATLNWMMKKVEEKNDKIFTLKEMYQKGGPRGIRKKDAALKVMNILEGHGRVRQIEGSKKLKYQPYLRPLLSCSTIKAAANKADISTAQIYEWLKDPQFKEELERQRNQMLEDAINKLKFGMTKAADTLVLLLDSDNEMVKRGVANDILNHVARFKELQELEGRISVLERGNKG